MYSDLSGHAPELNNLLELIAGCIISIAAIAVGVIALTTSIITLPAALAIILIIAGVSILLEYVTIARAQYNYSVSEGDSESEIFDDVINATGHLSIDRVLIQAGVKVPGYIGGYYLMSALTEINSQIQFLNYNKHVSSEYKRGTHPILAYAIMAYSTYRTARSFFDEQYCYDYAEGKGWEPW